MRPFSLRRRLLALLLGGVAAVWLAMLAASYFELREEVDELTDARMVQSARTLLLLDPERLHLFSEDQGDDEEHDEHMRHVDFALWRSDGTLLLRSPGAPQAAFDAHAGYAAWRDTAGAWRSYALYDRRHEFQVRVFEPASLRSGLAGKLTRRMAQMLLLALPVLAFFIWIATGRGLKPLATISRAIGSLGADNLQPVPVEHVPVEVQSLVDSLNKLLARLSESIDRERSFTADAAHELRTPLAAIKVQAEVALAAQDEAQRSIAIRQVITGVQRTTHLVQQLLLLARVDHAEVSPTQQADLGNIAVDSAARFADAAAQRGIVFDVEVEPGCSVHGDPAALSAMVDNLLDNAVKYGRDESKEAGKVEVRVVRESGQVCLAVMDDGPGVAEQDRPRLADRFYRVAGNRASGSGLGLSIVDRIVKRFGASLRIGEGIGGQGLGIRISFPS
jgi:two-component system sensor histidine kinase QseC